MDGRGSARARMVLVAGAAVLLVGALVGGGVWLYNDLKPTGLRVENRSGHELMVAGIPGDICGDMIVAVDAEQTYEGGQLCEHPDSVCFITSAFHVSCAWSDAKDAEPLVVFPDGPECPGQDYFLPPTPVSSSTVVAATD